MSREEILQAIRPFFNIEELVCDHTYAKWGEKAWRFLDTDYLHALLVIRRDIIKLPMWCNGTQKKQRGLRCNRCDLVRTKTSVYLSPHCLGKAGDFTISGMTATMARERIKANANLLPCKVRLEKWDSNGKEISWLHVDTIDSGTQQPNVYEFRA